jgi:ribose transport system permease protein
MAGVYKGVNLVLTKGVAITNIPESAVFLGRGDIGSLPTPFVIMLGLTVLIAIIAQGQSDQDCGVRHRGLAGGSPGR